MTNWRRTHQIEKKKFQMIIKIRRMKLIGIHTNQIRN
jgi:hypothetical protein